MNDDHLTLLAFFFLLGGFAGMLISCYRQTRRDRKERARTHRLD